jgi:hypothetical protein
MARWALIKADRPRGIDRVIDYFGGAGERPAADRWRAARAWGDAPRRQASPRLAPPAEVGARPWRGAPAPPRAATDGPFAETKELQAGVWPRAWPRGLTPVAPGWPQ